MKIPNELLAVTELNLHPGQSRRTVHVGCSDGKDPALSVTRIAEGWVFNCFRCDFKGFIGLDRLPADQIVKMVKDAFVKPHKEEANIKLPRDWKPMFKVDMQTWVSANKIPIEAYTWLWDAGITDEMGADNMIGWSDQYRRVIIPIMDEEGKLQGWIGRDVFYDKKTKQGHKYILRKQAGLARRIYFTKHQKDSTTVVMVEDILSAIRVNWATSFETVALLTTSVGTDLLHEYMDYKMVIWLDDDQLSNMVMTVARAQGFGIKATHINSSKDPKTYNDVAIQQMFRHQEGETNVEENKEVFSIVKAERGGKRRGKM